jgi:chromate transporter
MPRIGAALTAITAAVVGVILNLGVKFSTHALWQGNSGFDFFVAILAIASFLAMWRFKIPFTTILGACAVLGLASLWWK